ncbi:MAG: myo-inositol-1(or 4)-monophosphatase [Paracoccaceae bacterium]
MPERDLLLLIDAALEAGRIATGFSGPTAQSWDKADGAGPVTEADLAVNTMLEDRLQSARPDYGWLSEETDDSTARLTKDRVFIVDPIDGTRSFIAGAKTWAHALAVAEQGVVIAGVIFLPMLGLMYSAAVGKGAFLNGEPITPSDQAVLNDAEILATKHNLDPKHWSGEVPGFTRSHRPSLAYRMALVAQGQFDGMITLHPCWEWDIAAGDLILREAGAICTDKTGKALKFNNSHPKVNGVIAGGQAVQNQVLAALCPA